MTKCTKQPGIYVNAHGFLIRMEREEISGGLDIRLLLVEASEHAARASSCWLGQLCMCCLLRSSGFERRLGTQGRRKKKRR